MTSPRDDQLMELLRVNDDPVYAEQPPGFDRQAAEARFVEFAHALSAALGVACEFETGQWIQDASHHGSIKLPTSLLTEPNTISVRVSNFGRLCTAYDDDALVRPEVLRIIEEIATRHGYTYVPSRILLESYDGQNPGVSGFRDWGERFFDWI